MRVVTRPIALVVFGLAMVVAAVGVFGGAILQELAQWLWGRDVPR